MNSVDSCKYGFTIICIICTIFMVGYWIYKFAEEDRDIGVVDYKSFDEPSDIPFPVVSFCFEEIFIPKNIPQTKPDIDIYEYGQYLSGEVEAADRFERLNYTNITINLEDYFLYGTARKSNESIFHNDTVVFQHNVSFNGIFGSNGVFHKCFEVSSNIHLHRYVKEVYLYYNKTKLLDDLGSEYPLDVFYSIHYPGQFLLAPNGLEYAQLDEDPEELDIWMEDVELLRSRNSQQRACTRHNNRLCYDTMILQEHMIQNGCIPPYLKQHEEFPTCKTQKELKDAIYDFNKIRKKYIPIACERISRIYYIREWSNHDHGDSTWVFSMLYPDYIRVITQSKEVDVHSLIGNIGGYVGLFLGDLIFLDMHNDILI